MDSSSTPPPPYSLKSNPTSNSQAKSASRLSRITYSIEKEEPLRLSLDLVPSSPRKTPPTTPSSLSLKSSNNSLNLQELLLLSPSPSRKSRTRLVDRLEMAEEAGVEPTGSRRRCKTRGGAQLGSPRNNRRTRRRTEIEGREERDLAAVVEDVGKPRKRKNSGRSKKEKLALVPSSVPSSSSAPKVDDSEEGNLDRIGMNIYDLIMWKDAARSSLWFGFGCLCFLSSCFATGINFSIFSAISQIGLLFLGASFVSNSVLSQRNNVEEKNQFKLKEQDILRVGRLILPALNLAISKTRQLFSGEPSMTLKVTPFLLLGAEYGHVITVWRLCALGFFISFTVPRLYSWYSSQINQKAEYMKGWILEVWGACSHKKIVAGSAVTAFWNLSSVKTRIFTAFIALVILRYYRQHLVPGEEGGVAGEEVEQEVVVVQEQQVGALVVAGAVASQKQ